ncbi:SLATT domain-containing protein [Bacteroides reticulotermitis]|uniref:SLATT domain-containing protein n=1 Tax=Bacteroides reticulotermitis TaxID=1133319 RepID=UPI003A8C1D24
MENDVFLNSLSDKVWKTKKARFTAAKRMERFYSFSNISMALTSASLVGVNLIPLLEDKCCPRLTSIITILTIVLSVYVLVISLSLTQARFDNKAENYHACGCELTEYNDILQLYIKENKILDIEEKKECINKYHSIIKRYNLNHSSVDYVRALLECDDKSIGKLARLKNHLQWYIFNCGTIFILIAIIVPIIVPIIYIFYL